MSQQEPPQGNRDTTVKVAFITTLGVIIAAIITSVIAPYIKPHSETEQSQLKQQNPQHPLDSGPFSGPDVLKSNKYLRLSKALYSSDGNYRLFCQEDGNVVVRNSNGGDNWTSKSNKYLGNVKDCYMQGDGNFVVHSKSDEALWTSGTEGNDGAYLRIENDGHIHIYEVNSKNEIQCEKCRND